MRKDRLYFFTFLSIAVLFSITAVIAYQYLVKQSALKLLETHIEFSQKEAKTYAQFLGDQLVGLSSKDTLVTQIQRSLNDTENKIGFLSIYDWSGKVVAHPDIKKVGLIASPNNAFVSSVNDELSPASFYQLLMTTSDGSTQIDADDELSKVIALNSIANSDWILAAHIRTDKLNAQLDDFKRRIITTFLLMGLSLVIFSVIILRLLGSKYEKRLELKNEKLEDEVINLSKPNRAVGEYREKVEARESSNAVDDSSNKKRILTYIRNEFVPVTIDEIAYIYTENTITYVICTDGKRSTTNLSLDELYAQFDESYFFRANRQFIISIASIDKIVKYGNNQLKIIVSPGSDTSIIISKNKASQFKSWLNS